MEDEGEGGVGRIGDGGGRGMVRDREGVLPGVEDGEGDIASVPRVELRGRAALDRLTPPSLKLHRCGLPHCQQPSSLRSEVTRRIIKELQTCDSTLP